MTEVSGSQRPQSGLLPSGSPLGRRRSFRANMGTACSGKGNRQVQLEKVLGITVSGGSSLTCDPSSGLIAYPAGCVIVLLCPRKDKQSHIFNTSSKQLSALSFSPDGKFLVSGESGHKPAVRVWDVAEKVQVSEMPGHKYGISCVCFSPNMKYVVSVGFQHDMVVNVWDWKSNNIVAKNKVSSKVIAVSFSEDSSYFVTAGHRHVKFWYLESSKQSQVKGIVPLVGRSGLLGDLHNNVFGGVACGKGKNARSTYCVSYSGVLCQFSEKRVLEKWLKLKVTSSSCLCVTEEFVFCGCEEGVVRMFKAHNLQYVTDLPRPHQLGVDIALGLDASSLFTMQRDGSYPDTCALVYDWGNQWLCCVYNDHSVYVWDVGNTRKVGKVYSALYHSSYVWNIEVHPESGQRPCVTTGGSFFTCSSDNTVRLWNLEKSSVLGMKRNIYSNDLYKVIYASDNVACLKDTSGTTEKPEPKDSKSGIRVLKIRHDGRQLASGDRTGNIRIYDLGSFEEVLTIEAHDNEVLCLEYSRPWTGVMLLASASRDRLIHILDVDHDYSLLQTLDDHSSSITAVKFAGDEDQMHMISCGADKSIYFRPAQMLPDGIGFVRLHHVVEKTTLYDLDVDVSQKTAAVACQDKNIRLYNISSGKQERALKASASGGALLKMDPSGRFFATSCSNKNISIFDLHTGECVAVMYGHSDIVTDMTFTSDCRRLITVSGDSCIFVWQLDPVMTTCMRHQLMETAIEGKNNLPVDARSLVNSRRETFMVGPLDESSNDDLFFDRSIDVDEPLPQTPVNDGLEADCTFLQTNGKLPLWARKLDKEQNEPLVVLSQNQYRPQGRWAQSDSTVLIRNFLNSNDLSCTPNHEPGQNSFLDETTDIEPKSLQDLLESEDGNDDLDNRTFITEASSALEDTDIQSLSSESNGIFYPSSLHMSQQEESDFSVEERTFDNGSDLHNNGLLSGGDPDEDSLMSDNCSEVEPDDDDDDDDTEENVHAETPEQERFLQKHFDTLADALAEEKFDNTLPELMSDEDDKMLNPRLSFSSRFLSQSLRIYRTGSDVLPGGQQMATAITTETKVEPDQSQRRLSDRPTEKVADRMERRKSERHAEISKLTSSLQKLPLDEKTSSSRSSFPGCWPNKNKSNKGRSYMEATASSKAKILRSVSMGENINATQAEDHRKLSQSSRPVSSIDLLTLEQNKFLPAEDGYYKPHPASPSYEQIPSSHQEKVKTLVSSSNSLSDKLLMPPPSSYGILSRLKKKAKSVNNLSKASRKEEMNGLKSKDGDVPKTGLAINIRKRRNSSSNSWPPDVQDFPRRASIADFPNHASISSSNCVMEDARMSNNNPSSSCSRPEEPNVEVLASRCERVLEELHSAFQKTLQTYKEIESCGGSQEKKSHLRSLFFNAFDHVQCEIDLVGVERRKSSVKESMAHERCSNTPTLQLLEHYSDMMLQLMKEKINSQ
ncbi:WD repeat-containing protein 62 isoform X2 [Bufo bufo]|uniref:WD repeat-containing protein 62 isoform X2 n=1 Tax=Bufo bufo TaxID=8384 RepID=UPI001ABE2B38|nr:WD repeat-containing protein 62 isoform X2 [Bufo bufo]